MSIEEKNVVLAMGTRPEIIKMAPVYFALKKLRHVNPIIMHTGQHDSLAWPLYEFFEMHPTFELDIDREQRMLMFPGQYSSRLDMAMLTSALVEKISDTFHEHSPDMVLVHGDTLSAFVSALMAYYLHIPVGHVEAGLRSNNKFEPFPEEMNRRLIATIADFHFAPTALSESHLLKEGVEKESIYVVGNTVMDAVKYASRRVSEHPELVSDETRELAESLKGKKIILFTAHRRENLDKNIALFYDCMSRVIEENEDVAVVWPVHPNPKISDVIQQKKGLIHSEAEDRFHVFKPLRYQGLLHILNRTHLVVTDSGGIVEEAASLNIPSVILRNTSERQELLEAGKSELLGTDPEHIVKRVSALCKGGQEYIDMTDGDNPYGDGTSASKIAEVLAQHFGLGHSYDAA